MDTRSGKRRRIEQSCHACVIRVGVGKYDAGKAGIVRGLWRHDDRRRAGRCELLAVLGIGQKTDLAGAGACQGADLRNDDRTVAPQLTAKTGDDFV